MPQRPPMSKPAPITRQQVLEQALWHRDNDFILGLGLAALLLTAGIAGVARSVADPARSQLPLYLGLLIIAAALRAVLKFAYGIYRRSVALRGLPGPKYGFLGMMELVEDRKIHRRATEMAEEFGAIYKLRVLNFHAVVVTDPVLAAHVLRSKLLDKLRLPYSFLDPFLGGTNLLTGHTDAHWRAVRKAVAPAFSVNNMRGAFRQVCQRAGELGDYLQRLGPATPLNVDLVFLRENMDVIGEFGFLKDLQTLKSLDASSAGDGKAEALLKSTHEVELRIAHIYRWLRFWNPGARQGWSELASFRAIVTDLLGHIKKCNPKEGSFASLLLKARNHKTGQPLSDAAMFPEIAALFFAGVDTTSHTETFLLYLVSQHPHVEARIVAELDAAGLLVTRERPQPRELEWADLNRLEYLQAVIKETLRMYPPVGIGQIRVSQEDLSLGGKLFIPAGTALWVPHHAIQNTSFNWDRPTEFLPERWLEGQGVEYADPERRTLGEDWYRALASQASAAGLGGAPEAEEAERGLRPKRYFPFAEGARSCVGQSLAKVSLATTCATLLARFSFRLAEEMGGPEGVDAGEQYTLVVGMQQGMLMHAVPRAP